MNIYVIYDRKAMRYGKPTLFINDQVAIRDCSFALKSSANLAIAEDCELYQVGNFDDTTGKITTLDNLKFVSNLGV